MFGVWVRVDGGDVGERGDSEEGLRCPGAIRGSIVLGG